MSDGSPTAPSGERAALRRMVSLRPSGVSRAVPVNGVSTKPGATALTRMPLGPSSSARLRVSMFTAALVIA